MNWKNKTLIKKCIILILTFLIFILLFLKIDFSELINIFKKINLVIIFFTVLISLFSNLVLASDMWRQILKCLGFNITFNESLFIRTASYPFKVLLPLKSGEFLKIFYLKKQKKIPLLEGQSSVIFNIILNFLTLFSISLIGLIFINIRIFNIPLILLISLIFAFIILVFLKPIKNLILKLIKNLNKKIYNCVLKLFMFFYIKKGKQFYLLLYSLTIQLTILLNYFLIANSLSLDIPLYRMIILFPLIIIITFIPITVSGFGLREALVIILFSEFASIEKLLSWGIMISLIDYLVPAIFGLFFVKKFLNKIM